jgi:hypothetical protein
MPAWHCSAALMRALQLLISRICVLNVCCSTTCTPAQSFLRTLLLLVRVTCDPLCETPRKGNYILFNEFKSQNQLLWSKIRALLLHKCLRLPVLVTTGGCTLLSFKAPTDCLQGYCSR